MNLNINNFSLDAMLSLTEFRSLGVEGRHQAVMRLVPLVKPYICSIVETLVGLDYTIGEANSQLDVIDRPPHYTKIQGGSLSLITSHLIRSSCQASAGPWSPLRGGRAPPPPTRSCSPGSSTGESSSTWAG